MSGFWIKFHDAFSEFMSETLILTSLGALLLIFIFDYFLIPANQVKKQVEARMATQDDGAKKKFFDINEISQRLSARYEEQARNELDSANVLFTVDEYFKFMATAMVVGAFVGLLVFPFPDVWKLIFAWLPGLFQEVFGRLLAGAAFVYAGFWFPRLWLQFLIFRRQKLLEEQLTDALLNIADALKSGHVVNEAIRIVGFEMPYPIGPEFARASSEVDTGKSLQQALSDMKKRIHFQDFKMAINAMEIQFEVGGRLEPLLRNMVRIIQERYELRQEIKKTIATSKMTGYVLLGFPIGFVSLFAVMSKDTYLQMFHSIIGILMLFVAFVSYCIAAAIIIWIIRDVSKDI